MIRLLQSALFAGLLAVFAMPGLALGAASASAAAKAGGTSGTASYNWQTGPLVAEIMDQATLRIPASHAVLIQKDAQRLLRRFGNPNVANVVAVLTDASNSWIIVARFEKSGYVKDDDAKTWNHDALLVALRNGAEQTNQQRVKQNKAAIDVMGWLEKPAYDPKLHRLTWGIAVHDRNSIGSESQGINYNTFVLGREGYISLNLVTGLQNIADNKAHLTQLLSGLAFKPGKEYADFNARKDVPAKIGLSELVTGSALTGKSGAGGAEGFLGGYGKIFLALMLGVLIPVGGYYGWRFWKKRKAKPSPPALRAPVEPTLDGGDAQEKAEEKTQDKPQEKAPDNE